MHPEIPDNKTATASVFVELHNDLQRVPARGGFSLLNHDAPPMLVKDAAFHKFSEMSNIGPWLDREDKLQWDHKIDAGYRVARSVRNDRVGGDATKDALVEKEGYMINEHGQVCIAGFHKLGTLGGTATKDALIEKEDYMINEHGQVCIAGFHKLGNLSRDALIDKEGYIINERGQVCIAGYSRLSNLASDAGQVISFILSNLPSMIARICCGLGRPPPPRCAALIFA